MIYAIVIFDFRPGFEEESFKSVLKFKEMLSKEKNANKIKVLKSTVNPRQIALQAQLNSKKDFDELKNKIQSMDLNELLIFANYLSSQPIFYSFEEL